MNEHTRPGDDNGGSEPGDAPDGDDETTPGRLEDRIQAYVERYPALRADDVRHRLDIEPDAFDAALEGLVEAGRVEARTGEEDPHDVFLFSASTAGFWDDERTRPLFERTHEFHVAVHVAMFGGSPRRDVLGTGEGSRPENRVALRSLRRRGLVEVEWTLRGRAYHPSEVLSAWAREILAVKNYGATIGGVVEALREADLVDDDMDTDPPDDAHP